MFILCNPLPPLNTEKKQEGWRNVNKMSDKRSEKSSNSSASATSTEAKSLVDIPTSHPVEKDAYSTLRHKILRKRLQNDLYLQQNLKAASNTKASMTPASFMTPYFHRVHTNSTSTSTSTEEGSSVDIPTTHSVQGEQMLKVESNTSMTSTSPASFITLTKRSHSEL